MQILDRTVEDQADKLYQLILSAPPPSVASTRSNRLQFAVDALPAVHPSPAVFRKMVHLSVDNVSSNYSVSDRCPTIFQPDSLFGMFEADKVLWALMTGRHDYRERVGNLITQELLDLCKGRPWYSNSASLLLAVMSRHRPLEGSTPIMDYSDDAEKEASPWVQLFSGQCPPNVEELSASHFVGHPLYNSQIDHSPLENLIRKCFDGTYDFSATLLARQMERTFISADQRLGLTNSAKAHFIPGSDTPTLLPFLELDESPGNTPLMRFDKHLLTSIPVECRGLVLLGVLPLLESMVEELTRGSGRLDGLTSTLVTHLIKARAEGEGIFMHHVRSNLRNLQLAERVEEFVVAWLDRDVSVLQPPERASA
ncbi:hypothetical protein ACH4OY_31445 [Micromonospora rubida]|uniref:Uncharacterized protein n=1 Tax=Micromonospora rubida TaxID=2697657 RepID=A0ABW7STX6_9ACTN